MKIPKTIKIGWRIYEVKFINEEIRDKNGGLLDGQIDFNNHIIYIDNNIIYEDERIVTFLHEVVHGIFHSYCNSKWNDDEDLVECVAEGLFQLIRDNPKLFK